MVALLGFLLLVQKVVEVFLREKRRPINALQLRILLIAKPISAGDAEQFERLDFSSRRKMRSAAEVGELAGAIDRNLFIGLGELLDEMALHEVAFFFELFQASVARQKFARIGKVLLHQFLHLLFDCFQIFRGKWSGAIEIIEETGFGSRSVPEFGLWKQFKYSRSQKMG